MQVVIRPSIDSKSRLLRRPIHGIQDVTDTVKQVMLNVKQNGDSALKEYSKDWDGVDISEFRVGTEEMAEAGNQISAELKQAIAVARNNIELFHKSSVRLYEKIETTKGVSCWNKDVAIESVGLYIPGGSAPLFSTVLMLGIPAIVAGCKQIVLCSPAQKNGRVHPAVLYTASLLGIEDIFAIGGSQAIAAMTFGTKSIPKVNKIFGPGNAYVTKAKEMSRGYGMAIDMPAGPSELLIIADKNANAGFVAADLLSQAEHGADSQVVLLSDSEELVNQVELELAIQLGKLPRKEIGQAALKESKAIVLNSLEDCMDWSNDYGPEHLIVNCNEAEILLDRLTNAGSVFIGPYSSESLGDYASGPNHTLPTAGFAKQYSGVSVDDFVKKISFQKISKEGILNLGRTVEILAEAEQLQAHKNAVSIRLKSIANEN